MAQHYLTLSIPDTNNPRSFVIKDTSLYESSIPVVCERLEIIPPVINKIMNVEVEKGFDLTLSSAVLGFSGRDNLTILPDGLYRIKYSVSPNEKVYVEYMHLRITSAMISFHRCLSKFNMCKELSDKDRKILREYNDVKNYIEVAKAKVEDSHDINNGLEMFRYAVEKLNKLCNQSCKTC